MYSSIGIFNSFHCHSRIKGYLFPSVDADSGQTPPPPSGDDVQAEKESDTEAEAEEGDLEAEAPKKKRRNQIGFRDRKVRNVKFWY